MHALAAVHGRMGSGLGSRGGLRCFESIRTTYVFILITMWRASTEYLQDVCGFKIQLHFHGQTSQGSHDNILSTRRGSGDHCRGGYQLRRTWSGQRAKGVPKIYTLLLQPTFEPPPFHLFCTGSQSIDGSQPSFVFCCPTFLCLLLCAIPCTVAAYTFFLKRLILALNILAFSPHRSWKATRLRRLGLPRT